MELLICLMRAWIEHLAQISKKQKLFAVFDIPKGSSIQYRHTKTLALVFGSNTHIYWGNGDVIVGEDDLQI